MAKFEVTAEFVADLVFGFSQCPVDITGARFDAETRIFEFDIVGQDVPDAELVRAEIKVISNRRGEKMHSMIFRSAD